MYKEKHRAGIKKMITRIVIFAVFILVAGNFLPIKMSVNPNKLYKQDKNETMFICEYGQTTGPNWVIIGDSEGEFDSERIEFIDVKWSELGKEPNSSVLVGKNKYVLYGKFIGAKAIDGENYRSFEVKKWDILYPIDRFSLRSYFTPKRYLNLFDFLKI